VPDPAQERIHRVSGHALQEVSPQHPVALHLPDLRLYHGLAVFSGSSSSDFQAGQNDFPETRLLDSWLSVQVLVAISGNHRLLCGMADPLDLRFKNNGGLSLAWPVPIGKELVRAYS